MSSKQRNLLRGIAHERMRAEGRRKVNKRVGERKKFISRPKRKERPSGRSLFARNWHKYVPTSAPARRKRRAAR